MNSEQKYYTGKEVAEMLGVTTRTIRNYLKEGKLKGTKFGGRWNFTQADIDDYIQHEEQQYKSDSEISFEGHEHFNLEVEQHYENAELLEQGIEKVLAIMNQLIAENPKYQYRFFYKQSGENQAIYHFRGQLIGFGLLSERIVQTLKE